MARLPLTGAAIVALLAPHVLAEQFVFKETKSPNGRYVIAADGSASSPEGVYFADTSTGRRLGWIIRPEDAGISNLAIEAVWNAASSKVALLVAYGTKVSNLEIFEQDRIGTFVYVRFETPDPLALCRSRDPRALPASARSTAPAHSLGTWTSETTVRLLSGTEVVLASENYRIVTLYASFNVVVDSRARVENLQLFGPFDDSESAAPLEKWKQENRR